MRILLIDPKKPDQPQIPTLKELGYKQGIPATWFAVWVKDEKELAELKKKLQKRFMEKCRKK